MVGVYCSLLVSQSHHQNIPPGGWREGESVGDGVSVTAAAAVILAVV